MNPQELVKKFLAEKEMMQVATLANDQPWICTVYFVADEDLNLYWLSHPKRRHSRELKNHTKVAAAIPVKHQGHPVIGIQLEGKAEEVSSKNEIKRVMGIYTKKFTMSVNFLDDFLNSKDEHKLYRIKPTLFVLYDEENFKGEKRQEWKV